MIAAGLLLWGAAIPLALVLMLVAAVVTVVVGWFKPDEVERWMDKAIHFGSNDAGSFSTIEDQLASMKNLQRSA